MKATLTFDVEVASTQKATALRDKLAAELDADTDVTLTHQSMAQRSARFKVIGVDVATKSPFAETVEAADADDAKQQAIGNSKTRIVAEVTEGH